jgi:hypothetical protein
MRFIQTDYETRGWGVLLCGQRLAVTQGDNDSKAAGAAPAGGMTSPQGQENKMMHRSVLHDSGVAPGTRHHGGPGHAKEEKTCTRLPVSGREPARHVRALPGVVFSVITNTSSGGGQEHDYENEGTACIAVVCLF